MRSSHPAAQASSRLDHLRRTDPALRRRLLEVRTWALTHGIAVDVDAMTVVLGTVERDARLGFDPGLWTKARVFEFVWGRCVHWCLEHGTRVPPGSPEALQQYWAYLSACRAFSPGSDEPAVLARTLRSSGGVTPPARRARRSRATQAQGPALRA